MNGLSVARRRQITAPALLLTLVLAALAGCSSSGDGSAGDGASATSGSDPSSASHDDLEIKRDKGAAVTKTIGVEGGSIDLKAADGTAFAFEVPAGALGADTKITATPAELGGTDFDTALVMFEPSGLFFHDQATLKITPPTEVPRARQLFFGISDDASQVVAAPADPKDTSTTMIVAHFSGWGLATVTDAQRSALLERQASDASDRIASEMATALDDARRGGDEQSWQDQFEESAAKFEQEVLKPRLEAAGGSCEATKAAIRSATSYVSMRAVGGFGPSPSGLDLKPLLAQSLADGGPCEKEAIAKCKAAKNPSILADFLLDRERARALVLGQETTVSTEAIIKRAKAVCLGVYSASGGGSGLTVSGQIDDLSKPFTLKGEFPGAQVTLKYTPADDRRGSYTTQFSGSGVSGSTTGSYTIAGEDGEVLTLTGNGNGCVAQGGCRATTEVITLTPAG
ncbi:hypothetical protein [Aquihabitans sp. McL0605]|uniref:hypothetical protein n=1 Tax=Aquihabitans sp. McL0605 TaxID=3415671 RepID=UPI003CFA9794